MTTILEREGLAARADSEWNVEALDVKAYLARIGYAGEHWHLSDGGQTIENTAWSPPNPLPEGIAAADHVCFYPEKSEVKVDGGRIAE